MSARELRDAFNEVSAPVATCVLAVLNYEPRYGIEHQVLTFSGNYADGAGFVIQADPVRPKGDVMAAARATAGQLLQRKRD